MRRDIVFTGTRGPLALALGLDNERIQMLDNEFNRMIDANMSLREIIEYANEREDLTDAEWATFLYTIGFYQGRNSGLVQTEVGIRRR